MHGNEFNNLIGCLRYPNFPITTHGHGNAELSFCPSVCKAIKRCKSSFQNGFLLDKKLRNRNLLSKTDFYCNIKMKKDLFTTAVSLLHLQSAANLCGWKWKKEKIDLRDRGKKKIKTLFAGLGSVRLVKNCDWGVENAARRRRPRASFLRPIFNNSNRSHHNSSNTSSNNSSQSSSDNSLHNSSKYSSKNS